MLWEISHGCKYGSFIYTMVLFCHLLGKEGDLGGVMASCGELDKSPAMEQESTIKIPSKSLLTIKGKACYCTCTCSILICSVTEFKCI